MTDYWGYHLILDAAGCDHDLISSGENITAFAKQLVKDIDMVPYGEPQVVNFGSGNKAGYMKTVQERVIVKPLDKETLSSGGIIIPDSAAERPTRGRVVAVGKGRITKKGVTIDPEIKVGDIVMYSKYNGQVMNLDEGYHLLIKYSDVLCIVEE